MTQRIPCEARLLTLSDHRIIGPARIHPQAAAAEAIVAQLCQELGMYLEQYQGTTTMTQYLYPRTSLDRLVACHLLMNTLYYIDDRYDRSHVPESLQEQRQRQQAFLRCAELLRNGERPSNPHPLFCIFYELHQRLAPLSNPRWLNRLADGMIEHLHATLDHRAALADQPCLDVAHYIRSRKIDAGAKLAIFMIEFAYDMYLPEALLRHPYVQAMSHCCMQIGWLSNDLFSYHKEVIKGGSDYNLLAVLMTSEGLTFAEAVDRTVRMVNGQIDDFVQGSANLPVWPDPCQQAMAEAYICGLGDVISAAWHWELSTNRYRSPDSPFPELRTLLG